MVSRHNGVTVWIRHALLGACVVNSLFLIPNGWNSVVSFRAVQGLSNIQRRYLQRGETYRALLELENHVPNFTTVRLVSSEPPWYLAYFLYPRLLKKGSDILTDRYEIRKRYPGDWVLVYSEGPHPELTAYPPLAPHG